jgi:hypothetical protein
MVVVGNLSVCLGILIFFFMINVVIYMAWKKLDALSVGQMLIIDVVSIDHKASKTEEKARKTMRVIPGWRAAVWQGYRVRLSEAVWQPASQSQCCAHSPLQSRTN